MSTMLPLFPLQLVVFPEERLNLHIFEPRYKQLIHECETEGITFGIPAFIDGKVMDVGTEVKLLKVERRYPNGELDIRTQGMGIFRINNFFRTAPGKLYAAAEIERLNVKSESGNYSLAEQILELIRELFTLLNVPKELPKHAADFYTYDWAHHVGLTLEQEYELLCIQHETDRQHYLQKHLERILPRVREVEEIRRKAMMNGHFKNIIPPKV